MRNQSGGKPKVRGQVKQPASVAHCVGACAPPLTYRSTPNHQPGSVFKTVGVSSILTWAESQTDNAARPSGFPMGADISGKFSRRSAVRDVHCPAKRKKPFVRF